MLRAGFYQGDKLGAQAARAYRNALRDGLLAHVAISLEDALRAGADGTVLDGYISLHDEARRDPQTIAKAASQLWKLPESAKADLDTHLREALAERPLTLPRGRDAALIGKKR